MIKTNKSSIRILLLVIAALLGSMTLLSALPNRAPDFYVLDQAQVLEQDTRNLILGVNLAYEKESEQPQIVVLTVNDLGGLDSHTYAHNVLNTWGVGNREYDNGVLILLALQERRIEVAVGYGLEQTLSHDKVGKILDLNLDTLTSRKFDQAIKSIFYTISNEINNDYGYKGVLKGHKNIRKHVPNTNEFYFKEDLVEIFLFIIVLILSFLRRGFFAFFDDGSSRGSRRRRYSSRGGSSSSSGGGGRSGGGGAGRSF